MLIMSVHELSAIFFFILHELSVIVLCMVFLKPFKFLKSFKTYLQIY